MLRGQFRRAWGSELGRAGWAAGRLWVTRVEEEVEHVQAGWRRRAINRRGSHSAMLLPEATNDLANKSSDLHTLGQSSGQ